MYPNDIFSEKLFNWDVSKNPFFSFVVLDSTLKVDYLRCINLSPILNSFRTRFVCELGLENSIPYVTPSPYSGLLHFFIEQDRLTSLHTKRFAFMEKAKIQSTNIQTKSGAVEKSYLIKNLRRTRDVENKKI